VVGGLPEKRVASHGDGRPSTALRSSARLPALEVKVRAAGAPLDASAARAVLTRHVPGFPEDHSGMPGEHSGHLLDWLGDCLRPSDAPVVEQVV
jgi:hypothetical protein